MKLPFLNRSGELSRINRARESSEPVLMIMYGRRRCGKSRLLNQLPHETVIYHLADLSEPVLQRANLAHDINRHFPGFADVVYPGWESLFAAFFIRASTAQEKLTLIIDEFPYIAQLDKSVASVIQKLYDRGQFGSHCILCGSSQRMMHGLVMDATAPLYGRAQEILKIRPLMPGWIRSALKVEGREACKAYAVWGGVPRYWEAASNYGSITEGVSSLVFHRDALFHQEPHRLLMDDMRTDVQPHSLLSVIAAGANRLSEIAGRVGKPAVRLGNPLGTLIDLGYVKRDVPFGESLHSTRRTLYRIADPFLLFWYRWVYPSLSLLEQDVLEPVVKQWEAGSSRHCGDIWEELARQSVPHLTIGGLQWREAYRWWGKGRDGKEMEFDIVASSLDGSALLAGEVKWGKKKTPDAILNRLRKAVENAPFYKKQKVVFGYWQPEENTLDAEGLHCIDARMTLDALMS
jgi:hypothetical protein